MGMTEAIAPVLVLVALVEAIKAKKKKNNRPLALSDYFNKSNTANRL